MEQERVYHIFDKSFAGRKDVPIALYGLGINTRYLLEKAKDYNIVGIVAKDRIGECIYGRRVMPLEAIEGKARIVVIVAQSKSVKLIYDRIRHIEEKGIEIYDIYGERVRDYFYGGGSEAKDDPYWASTFDELKREIEKHDIISFDVFDTLITRKVPAQEDIWDIVERELREKGWNISFKKERMKAEGLLSAKGEVPALEDIYDVLGQNAGIEKKMSRRLMEMEIETEKRYAVKRRCVAETYDYGRLLGKEVYVLSNGGLPSEQVYRLLQHCDIKDIDMEHILSAGDAGKTRNGGTLYDIFARRAGRGSKLHVSSRRADIEAASRSGMDTFFVMGAGEMLSKSSVSAVAAKAAGINDRIVLGLFASKAFNDPFALPGSRGKLKICSMYDLGYYCFGPVTMKFLAWMVENLRNDERSIVLFSSRDGYLLCELYRRLRDKNPQLRLPEGLYFYTSRRAVTVAGILSEEDIRDIVRSVLKLSMGNLREVLEQRLGIAFDREDPVLNRPLMDLAGKDYVERIEERVLEYKDEIFSNASEERKHLLMYLDNNNLWNYDRIYLFDLYTRGTGFRKLGSLMKRDIQLLCYAVKDFPNEIISSLDKVKSMFDSTDPMSGEWFRRSYQVFETVYSSPEGQLKCFDSKGDPVFLENSEYNYHCIKSAQSGISDFIGDLELLDEKWYMHGISTDMADSMGRMMARKYSDASDEISSGFDYYDSFASDSPINIWNSIV